MQNHFGLLDTDVMPIFLIIALDIVIIMRSSMNCSAVICSPTVLFAILREATSETYGPRVYFPSYKFSFTSYQFPIYYFAIFTFRSITQKYQKYLLYCLSISIRDHVANNREGIDHPLSCWVHGWCLFVQVFGDFSVISYQIDTLVLKLREILTLLCCITLSSSREKPTQAQEVAMLSTWSCFLT